MKLSSESKFLINQTISALMNRFSGLEENVVTDIHFQPNFTTGELLVFDDEEETISQVVISELEGLKGGDAYAEVSSMLLNALERKRKDFEQLSILKPYSLVLVDDEKETIEDLLLIDDDLIIVQNGLLAGLDQELDDFLKELLSED